jgi:hypothetical protein
MYYLKSLFLFYCAYIQVFTPAPSGETTETTSLMYSILVGVFSFLFAVFFRGVDSPKGQLMFLPVQSQTTVEPTKVHFRLRT